MTAVQRCVTKMHVHTDLAQAHIFNCLCACHRTSLTASTHARDCLYASMPLPGTTRDCLDASMLLAGTASMHTDTLL
eukprot:1153782-Pelagomonas_calceolata.AAC.3